MCHWSCSLNELQCSMFNFFFFCKQAIDIFLWPNADEMPNCFPFWQTKNVLFLLFFCYYLNQLFAVNKEGKINQILFLAIQLLDYTRLLGKSFLNVPRCQKLQSFPALPTMVVPYRDTNSSKLLNIKKLDYPHNLCIWLFIFICGNIYNSCQCMCLM